MSKPLKKKYTQKLNPFNSNKNLLNTLHKITQKRQTQIKCNTNIKGTVTTKKKNN